MQARRVSRRRRASQPYTQPYTQGRWKNERAIMTVKESISTQRRKEAVMVIYPTI
jgi:hypothetical protein